MKGRTLARSYAPIDFSSNDYFGFARSQELIQFANQIGATGSRLLTGNYPLYRELESELARFHNAESARIFNCGYMANLGLISALGTKEVTFIYDLEIHASMIDGMRLSSAKCLPFRHNDLDSLERQLKRGSRCTYVLVESVYSVSGDSAPLLAISTLCKQYGAHLIVDEAHATGVYGKKGEGLASELAVFARVYTWSKALGIQGACVVGSNKLTDHLINVSRPFIYSTALAVPLLLLVQAAYKKLAIEAPLLQTHLQQRISYFQRKSKQTTSSSPIQPIYIPGIEKVRRKADALQANGLDVRALVPPTTKRGKECLRIVLHSFNKEEEIDELFEHL